MTNKIAFSFCCFVAMLLIFPSCNPKTYDFQKNYDTAFDHQFVKELKGNNLFIKLENNDDIIKNHKKAGHTQSADFQISEDRRYNQAMIVSFKKHWNFCDIYFYTDKLYFNTKSFEATDLKGKKHLVELDREQLFKGTWLRYRGNFSLMIEKWPEDGSGQKNSIRLDVQGLISRSNINFLVAQMQRRLDKTYNLERL